MMTLPGVHDEQALRPGEVEHRPAGSDRFGEQRHVVAERFAKAARLQEVALHVDDDERGIVPGDRNRLRIGVDQKSFHAPTLVLVMARNDTGWRVVNRKNRTTLSPKVDGARMACDFNDLRAW